MRRFRLRSGLIKAAVAVVVLVAGLTHVGPADAQIAPGSAPVDNGAVYAKATRMSASAWRARQNTYLAAATSGGAQHGQT